MLAPGGALEPTSAKLGSSHVCMLPRRRKCSAARGADSPSSSADGARSRIIEFVVRSQTLLFLVLTLLSVRALAQPVKTSNPAGDERTTTWAKGWKHERPKLDLGKPQGETVFRGDERPPLVILKDGFQPRGTNLDLEAHLRNPTSRRPDLASAYISTSTSRDVAGSFVIGGNFVYEIVTSKGIDVSTARPNLYTNERELAVPGGIAPGEIRGFYDRSGAFHPAPNSGIPAFATDVVARQIEGIWRDAQTGRLLTAEEVVDAQARLKARPHDIPRGVTILETSGEGSAGSKKVIARGELGEVTAGVLGADGAYRGKVGVTREGLAASGYTTGRLVLAGATATSAGRVGSELTNASASARGDAFVGAEGTLDGVLRATKSGFTSSVSAGGLFGAKVKGVVTGSGSICGLAGSVTTAGEASYGIGGEAMGYLVVDWATFTAKAGAHGGLTLGPGAGAGVEVEVSLDKFARDPGAALSCLNDLAAAAVSDGVFWAAVARIRGLIQQVSESELASNACLWCPSGASGFNGSRDGATVSIAQPSAAHGRGEAGLARGAGMRR